MNSRFPAIESGEYLTTRCLEFFLKKMLMRITYHLPQLYFFFKIGHHMSPFYESGITLAC
jgi:hypothetical protein